MAKIEYQKGAERLAEISRLLIGANDRADLGFTNQRSEHWPNWYWSLLTKLHVATQGEPIVYLTSDLRDGDGHTVIAFTERLVAEAKVIENRDAQRTAEISVDVWSRRAVQQISLKEVDAFPSKATAYPIEFPGGIRVEASYRGRDRWLKLPLGSNPTRAAEEDTAALHAALIEDLA